MRQLAVVPFSGFQRGQDARLPSVGLEGAREAKAYRGEVVRRWEMSWKDLNGRVNRALPPDYVIPYLEAIGFEKTAKVFLKLGGSHVFFANQPTKGALVEVLGVEDAAILGRAMTTGRGIVPIANEFLARYLRGTGASVYVIAKTIRRTDTTVRELLRLADDKNASNFNARPKARQFGGKVADVPKGANIKAVKLPAMDPSEAKEWAKVAAAMDEGDDGEEAA